MKDTYIGLFGTCGSSTWRNTFITKYESMHIKYFNPQWPEGTWHAGCIPIENEHLMTDEVILFPVTSETTGQGSLAEIGFSISAALRRNPDRYFVFLIDNECKDVKASPNEIKDSNRSRSLVKSKLQDVVKTNSGIYLVDTLDQMLDLSIGLYMMVQDFKSMNERYANHG